MPLLRDMFRHFLYHAAMAATVWSVLLIGVEQVIPRFAIPYVNVAGVFLITLSLNVVASLQQSFKAEGHTPRRRELIASTTAMSIINVLILRHVTDGSILGLGLAGISILLTATFFYLFAYGQSRML